MQPDIDARSVLLSAPFLMLESGITRDAAVLVEEGRIVAIGESGMLAAANPEALRIDLAGQVLMPGFVNAHQHGRGLTSMQLGNLDDHLELWLARSRNRRSLAPHLVTSLAALRMAANGVTSAIHANTPYGVGDFRTQVTDIATAYETIGLRVMVGIGARDRAEIVYPDTYQSTFVAGLPESVRAMLGNVLAPAYADGTEATIRLMDDMQASFEESPLITFAYAPAGPQWVSDAMWRALGEDAARRGVGLHTHAVESYAQAASLAELYPRGLIAHLADLGVASRRLSLAHAVWLTDDDVRLAQTAGVSVVRNPGSNLRLRAGIAPLAAYRAAGLNVALGSDSMTLHDDEDLFCELRLAVNLARSPMWDGPAPPSPSDMLRMTTVAGAIAMQREHEVGTIAVGHFADMIAVSLDRVLTPYLDPDVDLAAAIYARARGEDVRMTMVGGRIIYRDGVFPFFDAVAVVRRAVDDAAATRIESAEIRQSVEQFVAALGSFYGSRHTRLRDTPWRPVAGEATWV